MKYSNNKPESKLSIKAVIKNTYFCITTVQRTTHVAKSLQKQLHGNTYLWHKWQQSSIIVDLWHSACYMKFAFTMQWMPKVS